MERNGEGEDAPGKLLLVGARVIEQTAASAVDVGLATVADGLKDLAPVAHDGVQFLEDAAADEPVARLAEVFGSGIIAVLPDAVFVENLNQDVGTDGQRETRIKEVAGIDDDRSAAAFGSEGTEGVEEILDRAVALEQMHVFDSTEETVERGREDDNGDVGAAAAEQSGDLCTELAVAEVIVQDRDINVIEELGGLFDGGGGNALIAMLTKDGGAENEVVGLVV